MAAPFTKKTYTLRRFLRDVGALTARSSEVAGIVSGETMDPVLRESIMVTVARVNRCRYCVYAHEDAARHAGVSSADISAIGDFAAGVTEAAGAVAGGRGGATVAALAYAAALTDAGFGPVDAALEAEVVAESGEEGRARVEAAARLMTVANLCGNTVDAFLSRLRGEPDPHGHVVDEIAITALWIAGAVPSAWNIWRARGGSPLALLADFTDFVRGFDADARAGQGGRSRS